MLSEPPLVGRDEELGYLQKMLEQATSGSGGLVLLAGEAGIGKTRLATEFEKKARTSGCRVLVGNCLPSAQIPYLVFLEALNQLFEEESHDKMSRSTKLAKAAKKAAPDLMKAIPVFGGIMKASAALFQEYRGDGRRQESSKEHVLFKTLDILKVESSKTPLILHLDDLQWADSMSIAMLHFLARNCRDLRVLLFGTYRSEEVLNQEGGIHPLLDSIRVMKRENIVQEIELRPLAEKELNQVVQNMLDLPVNDAVLSHIFKESGGSPLFAVEAVRLLMSTDRLSLIEGEYTVTGQLADAMPSTVKEVILRRLERISKGERRSIDYASVVGMNFSPRILAEAMRTDYLSLLESLERLSDQHQLVKEIGTEYAFTHEKVRQTAYDGMSRIRRKGIHGLVGMALEKRLPDDNILGEISMHFDQADEREKCIKYSLQAGKMYIESVAIPEAILCFGKVVKRTGGDPSFQVERSQALEGMGDAYWLNDQDRKAFESYEECLEINDGLKGRARVLLKAAGCWAPNALGNGDWNQASRYFEEAASCPNPDSREKVLMDETRGMMLYWQERYLEATPYFKKAIEGYEALGDKLEALKMYGFILNQDLHLSRIKEAKEVADFTLRKAKELANPKAIMYAEVDLGEIHWRMGEANTALELLSDALELAVKLGDDYVGFYANEYMNRVNAMMGRHAVAKELGLKALGVAEKAGIAYLVATANTSLGFNEASLANIQRAEGYYRKSSELVSSFSGASKSRLEWRLPYLRAEILALKDMHPESTSLFEESIRSNEEKEMWFEALEGLVLYGGSLKRRDETERARLIFEQAMQIARQIGCEKKVIIAIDKAGLPIP